MISFKLETDESLLISKAKNHLAVNGVDLVIANLLNTRKTSVLMVTKDSTTEVRVENEQDEIEIKIVEYLLSHFIKN